MPAQAFYEWVGPKKERQPLNIARTDGILLSMAGLFNYWKPFVAASQGRPMLPFTVVTTAPNRRMERIHNRMPVVLQDDHIDTWLDPTISDPRALEELLKAPPENFLGCYPVWRKVNSVKFDEPEYAEKIDLLVSGNKFKLLEAGDTPDFYPLGPSRLGLAEDAH